MVRIEKKHVREKIKYRKNYLPTFVVTLFLWFTLLIYIYLFPPEGLLSFIIFFGVLFLAILFTFSLLLANTRRGFMVSFFVVISLILRYFGIATILNTILLLGAISAFELFFSHNR